MTLASLFFYCFASWRYLPFFAATLLTSYYGALQIRKVYRAETELLSGSADAETKKAIRAVQKQKAKRILTVCILTVCAFLVFCKYSNFLIGNLNAVMKLFSIPALPLLKLIQPLGISYYTFMSLSYLLDVYWKRYEAEEDLIRYSAYLLYFPHIVEGPIDRYNEFKSQLEGVSFKRQNLEYGFELFLWGLFKKLVIADRMAIFVNEIYSRHEEF